MYRFLSTISTVLLFCVVTTNAQVIKKGAGPKATKTPAKEETSLPSEYEIYVAVSKMGVILVGVTPKPTYPATVEDSFQAFLRDHFGVAKAGSHNSRHQYPKIVISFVAEDSISSLVRAINLVRVSEKAVVELESLLDHFRLVVPPNRTELEMVDIRPNPLALVVEMNEQKGLTLNNEEMGSLSDMTRVTSALRQIFKDRLDNGVFRENSNEIEKTVFIKMPLTASAGDLIKIAKALQEAGADVIGFQVDETVNERLDIIPGLPVMPGPRKKPIK